MVYIYFWFWYTPNHPFLDGDFSQNKPSSYWGIPHDYGTPIYQLQWCTTIITITPLIMVYNLYSYWWDHRCPFPIGWLINRGGWNYPYLQQVNDGRWYTSHRPKPLFTKRTWLDGTSMILIWCFPKIGLPPKFQSLLDWDFPRNKPTSELLGYPPNHH